MAAITEYRDHANLEWLAGLFDAAEISNG